MLPDSGSIIRGVHFSEVPFALMLSPGWSRECIDYMTSMITDEDPLRGLLFYKDLGLSHTLHVLKERRNSQRAYGRVLGGCVFLEVGYLAHE